VELLYDAFEPSKMSGAACSLSGQIWPIQNFGRTKKRGKRGAPSCGVTEWFNVTRSCDADFHDGARR